MLTVAAVGMAACGLYEAGWALIDLVGWHQLEIWADLAIMFFGLLLVPAAAFVRIRFPGGLALALGALLGLQAFSLHSAAHLDGRVVLSLQIGRAAFAAALVALAYIGSAREG
jgi:hypothetical protein